MELILMERSGIKIAGMESPTPIFLRRHAQIKKYKIER